MYKNLNKIRLLSFILIFLGIVLFIIGYYTNNKINFILDKDLLDTNEITLSKKNNIYNNFNLLNSIEKHHLIQKLHHQINNRPWSAFYVSSCFFFGISTSSLLFLAILNVSNSGWSVIIHRVIEILISFIPYTGILIFLVLLGSLLNYNHLFHWMEADIINPNKNTFDLLITFKSNFLNKTFFSIRIIFYLMGFVFFGWYIKLASKRLDDYPTLSNYWNMYRKNVLVIIFYCIFMTMYCWDLIMSIDVHWYSTLFSWYLIVSCLVASISCIILLSFVLKKLGYLPLFNHNHLHDLAKYLFGFSLLWSYFWFTQFMLYWYANIPEEVVYFLGRYNLYKSTFFTMLIPNFFIPLLVLLSSSIKRNSKIVSLVALIVLLGHWLDYFNAIMPGTVGSYWGIGFLEIGSLIFFIGLFILIINRELSHINMEHKGHPYFLESKFYHYLF